MHEQQTTRTATIALTTLLLLFGAPISAQEDSTREQLEIERQLLEIELTARCSDPRPDNIDELRTQYLALYDTHTAQLESSGDIRSVRSAYAEALDQMDDRFDPEGRPSPEYERRLRRELIEVQAQLDEIDGVEDWEAQRDQRLEALYLEQADDDTPFDIESSEFFRCLDSVMVGLGCDANLTLQQLEPICQPGDLGDLSDDDLRTRFEEMETWLEILSDAPRAQARRADIVGILPTLECATIDGCAEITGQRDRLTEEYAALEDDTTRQEHQQTAERAIEEIAEELVRRGLCQNE